jgi:O-antigen/teichoic acid export membrane protein
MSGMILQWSILFLSFLFLLQINFNIFAAIWELKIRLYIILFGLFINIINNIIFINMYGVAGAALATGIGWIVIWGLSEYFLKEYSIQYNWKYLWKNILIFALVSSALWVWWVPFFEGLSRGESFLALWGISLLYFGLYVLVNKKDFEYFISEVKKLRWKKG